MSPMARLVQILNAGVPRASGDEPDGVIWIRAYTLCSPRERG